MNTLPRFLTLAAFLVAATAARAAEPAKLSPDAAEPQVVEFLAKAGETGDAFAANLALKAWLARHPSPAPAVLVAAGDTARAAGDLQAAASLYKSTIAAMPADEARSRVAARLYEILVGCLQSNDDAYSFFARSGFELRQSLEARQFDGWFLGQALARRDAVMAAKILAAVMAEKLPLELERNAYWDSLDWTMGELARATPDKHAAAPAARQIVGLVRESPPRAARYGFITAWLEFQAAVAGKDAAAQAAAFAPVAAAGAAYVDAVPTAAVLNDVLNTFFCGTNNHDAWKSIGGPITGLWTAGFEKLPDDEKAKAIDWNSDWWQYKANGEQWMELGGKYPAVFQKAAGTRRLPLLVNKPDPAVFAKQATMFSGVESNAAKVINAVAATKGTDLRAGLEHLYKAESWYGDFGSTWAAAGQMWGIYRSLPRQPAANDADWNKALAAWAPEAVYRTPIALFQPEAAAGCLAVAFAAAPLDDKSAFAADLRRLDWVPWDDKSRTAAITPVHNSFKQWADQVRNKLTASQAAAKAAPQDKAKADEVAKWEKTAGQIAPLEEEFKKAFDVNVPAGADWAKLADPLAMHLGRCVQAAREKKADAYVAGGREAYKLIRAYFDKKTPFGGPALNWLLSSGATGLEIVDFQAEVVADQIAAWQPGAPTGAITAINASLVSGRPNGNYTDVPADRKGQALKLNAAIGKGILAQLEKNRFEPELFTRFRYSKMGSGWNDQEAGKDVMAKLIDTKAFLVHKQNPAGPSATTSYQQLVRQEFQGLAKTYPVETYFDDMFVEESKANGWLDGSFLNYSQDQKQKAATLAAEMFAGFPALATGPAAPKQFDRLPQVLVAGERRDVVTGPPTWTAADVNNWYGRASSAPAAARAKFVEAAEAGWGKTRFDGVAMGYASIPADPAAIAAAPARADYFKKVAALLERRKSYPLRTAAPSLAAISQTPANSFKPEEVAVLAAVFDAPKTSSWSSWPSGSESFGTFIAQALQAGGREADLPRAFAELWRIPRDFNNPSLASSFAAVPASLAKAGKTGIAAAIAESGMQIFGAALPDAARTQLAAIRTDALLSLGGSNPVPRNDPRWAIYEAQMQLAAGRPQGAWQLYLTNPAIVAQIYKELDPDFTAWLIRENTATGNYDRARELGQLLLVWTESAPGVLSPEAQAGLLVAYADIALARREYAQARALYERIAAAKEFDGSAGKADAELRVAEVDRLTRQFDRARELLQKLSRRSDRGLQSEAFYQLALLKTDQEEIEEAAGFLQEVFTRIPNHVGGRILEGKLNLLRRKYDVASKVKLGVLGDKKFLIPGKPLEVDLEDRNLAVVGKAAQIEIRAWTASGDEEHFNLFPFGDSKTRFTGQIPTQLGPPSKGDRILQLLGGDTVRYTFAESFTAGSKGNVEEPAAMTVVTDAEVFASSGAILSKEELENRALEKMIRAKLELDQGAPQGMSLAATRSEDQIKPGNPVNVRVVDPDRGTTAQPDTIDVRATTASGDSLVVKLTETGPYSGVFEGTVPTGSSQATATASDSTEGNDPNNCIGPGSGTPWIGLADNKRPKAFAVDLNDNVALGKMTVTANVPGRKLKDVYVQTSLNGRDFRTVGQWRADGKATFVPWDGGPRMELVRYAQPGAQPPAPTTPAAFAAYLERGRLSNGSPLVTAKIDSLAVGPWDGNLGGQVGPMALNTGWYVGHWVAGFEIEKPQTRSFTLDPKRKTQTMTYVFAIDGQVSQDRASPLKIERALAKGVHRIDVYAYAHHHEGLNFEVLIDAPEAPFTASIPKDVFSIEKHPAIADAFATAPAEIKSNADGSTIEVAFAEGTRARVVRFVLADFETDAPAINAVTLVDAKGKKVLPTEKSFLDLAKNDVLEIIPGDKLTVLYEDPTVITQERAAQERFLTATFTNAEVSATFVEFKDYGGERRARYVPMRRFGPGDTVKVFIGDPDMDTTPEPDRVGFTVKAGRGKPVAIEALETEPHSGIFIGTVFPVAGEPQRPTELKVAPGEDLLVAYLDRENSDPGILWERTSIVEQAGSDEPQLRVYDVASRPLDEAEKKAIDAKREVGRRFGEHVPVTREIVAVRPEKLAEPGTPAEALVDGPLLVELLAPAIAKSAESQAEIFVQTEAGREKLGRPVGEGEFPLDVPGTIRLVGRPSNVGGGTPPPGVSNVVVRGDRFAVDPLAEGRFTFLVGKELGPVPDESLATIEDESADNEPPLLQVRGNDTVYVGHRTTGKDGGERWNVQPVKLTSDVLFDVMDDRYQNAVVGTFVGDSLHVRLIHPSLDVSDEKDTAIVRLAASGGGELELPLAETFGHSGIFKGVVRLSYRDNEAPVAADAPAAADRGLPVAYGETVKIRYEPPAGEAIERTVEIFKGGDGRLVPFTKRFNDPTIAVQTQFTVAEAWFELAKRHRELGQESLARREITQGKKLLEEAIRDYPDTEARAQADYLLANLSFEFSKEAANEDLKRQHALDAVARFSDIVSSHPDSEYAPKSQYKKALVLEALGDIDQACEEYVKLSYRYPDNELVAETIARLGQYFLAKGKQLDEESNAQTDRVEKEKVAIRGREMFTTAAEVFSRLSERFPRHALANKTKMLSAQCYLRAKDFKRALASFEGIAKDPQTEKDLAAEAMYWAGDVCLQQKELTKAYKNFKKLTWDFPESKWAKFARGRLSEDAMAQVEAAIEKEGQ
jgi:TolA-binding protein